MYNKSDWMNAFSVAEEAEWDEVDIRESGNVLAPAVLEAYESDVIGQDLSVLEAAIEAARSRYSGTWDSAQFEAVWTNYVGTADGWQGVAEDYLDDHYPGLVTSHGTHMDLEGIGREYAREHPSTQYVTIPDDGNVYIFNKI